MRNSNILRLKPVKANGLTHKQQDRLNTHIRHVQWAANMRGKPVSETQVLNQLLAKLNLKSIDTLEQLSEA